MPTPPSREDRHGANARPVLRPTVRPVEEVIFGDGRTRVTMPAAETLRVMLDCGRCIVSAPQAAIRRGTFDSTCSKRHNRGRS